MIGHLASETVRDTTRWAKVVYVFLVAFVEEIVTVFRKALNHVRVLVSDLLPFELLATFKLLLREEVA